MPLVIFICFFSWFSLDNEPSKLAIFVCFKLVIAVDALLPSTVFIRSCSYRTFAIYDFQLFPVFDSHTCAHPHCKLHLILVIIFACTLFYLFAKITLTILLLVLLLHMIALLLLLQVCLPIFTYFLCSILVSKCAI